MSRSRLSSDAETADDPDSGAHGKAILRAVGTRTSPGDVDLLRTIDSLLGG
jgi:hypothetical protein